jgi:hypothetical protein
MDQPVLSWSFAMKITIHIQHNETDDLVEVEAAARRLGLAVSTRGDFMGKHHAELVGEMSADTLAGLFSVDPELNAVAA